MFVYLVRHGQTQGNLEHRVQSADTPLTLEGEQQAEKLTARLSPLKFDQIIASPLHRAQQTAKIIAANQQLGFETWPLLSEQQQPTHLYHKTISDPEIVAYQKLQAENQHNPDFSLNGGESATAIVTRAQQLLDELAKIGQTQPDEYHLCAVSHGLMISTVWLTALLSPQPSPLQIINCRQKTRIENTGISVLRYSNDQWRTLILNDSAHL